jgi:UDP-N-acetylmuramoyl-L-alanyl-D-glutamate--2,6-diaminopimelate ligase
MKIKQLIQRISVLSLKGDDEKDIIDFSFDSRKIEKNSLFIALKGTQMDGHAFIDIAIEKGAIAIVCESLPVNLQEEITYILVEDSATALAYIAANFYENPARSLKIIGITGTNGKTSTATLLWQAMNDLGYKSGLISTIKYMIGTEERPSSHTTPDPKQLHACFAEMLEMGCEYCFMEVSSHALVQKRTEGIPFHIAVFTNITHDHLDYHGTFAEYIKAKKILFDTLPASATAILNGDDRNASIMVQNCTAKVQYFSLRKMADIKGKILDNTFEGLQLEINGVEAWFRLVGSFNAYNLLGVFAVMTHLGIEPEACLRALSVIPGVNGRFEVLNHPNMKITAIVDYAHTPDALKNVLNTIHDINQTQGKIITVVGCGGNRDKEKRPKMAQLAASYSHTVILTSDNPRKEDPNEILKEMYAGVSAELKKKVMQIENRKEAIGVAIRLAQPHDIILIAGKGHENYQEIHGIKHHFDDKEVVKEYFEIR